MKKSFMVFMVSGMFIGAAQADLSTDYDKGLDDWGTVYPVINNLRQQPLFHSKSREVLDRLKDNPEATPRLVLRQVIEETIPSFIKNMENDIYFNLVEGLDPVYRDVCGIPGLVPLLPTVNESPYKVKHIFSQG